MRLVTLITVAFVVTQFASVLHGVDAAINCPYVDSGDGFTCSLGEPCCGDNTKNPSCLDTGKKNKCCVWYKSAIQCGEKQACCGQYGPDVESSESFCCDEGSMCCHSQYLTAGATCCPQGSTCCPGLNGGVCCGPDEVCVDPNAGLCQKSGNPNPNPPTNAPAVPTTTPAPPQPTSVPATSAPNSPPNPFPTLPPPPPPDSGTPSPPTFPTLPPTPSPPSQGGPSPSGPTPDPSPGAFPTQGASPAPDVPTPRSLLTTPTPRVRERASAMPARISVAFSLGVLVVIMATLWA